MRTLRLLLLRPSLEQQVRNLFRMSEQGAWYDPAELASMYQHAYGTTAAAIGSVVGLLLDKRFALARGVDLVTNGTFSGSTSGWTAANGATIAAVSGELVVTNTAGGPTEQAEIDLTSSVSVAKTYELLLTARKGTAVTGYEIIAETQAVAMAGIGASNTSAEAKRMTFTVPSGTVAATVRLRVLGVGTAIFDNISIREIPGSHALQADGGKMPDLAAGYKIDYDAVDDELVTTWASALGTNCTVGRAVPGIGASILTGQTIGTTYTDNTDHCGLVIIDRALNPQETLSLTRYLNRKAGI
jgi:hypothetical protein